MNRFTLLHRSLRYFARSHLGAVLGSGVAGAVLIGALVVGDSVRGSLVSLTLGRLGNTRLALLAGDRFVRESLAAELADPLDAYLAPVVYLAGTAAREDASARANRVFVIGAESLFMDFAPQRALWPKLKPGEVTLNPALATQLRARVGDTLILRVPKPTQLSGDAPLSPEEDTTVALRVQVQAILPPEALTDFSLAASQRPPWNAFVSLPWLQERLGLVGKANLILVGPSAYAQADYANLHLKRRLQLTDAALELRPLPDRGTVELRTSRVFLDPPVADLALPAASNATGVLTYFVNELRVGDRSTPYSMVTAMGSPVVPADMKEDEILINDWLADDLGARVGDTLQLAYYAVGVGRALEERTATFRVRGVVPLAGPAGDRTLMPDFPGLTEATNCREWDTGFPIQLDRIRDQDNRYWEEHRGTPKAFVTLAAGQKLWANRFGNLTAVRYAAGTTNAADLARLQAVIQTNLLTRLKPASIGLRFEPVRQQAFAAVTQSQDFSGLFLGFSFFLIVAALLLLALLFQFGVEQRAAEAGTLLALGFTPRQTRRAFLLEGGVVAAAGTVLGVLGGVLYARAILHALSTVWRGAVGTSNLELFVRPATLEFGAVASLLVAWITIALVVRRLARRPARDLLSGAGDPLLPVRDAARGRRLLVAGVFLSLAALGLVGWGLRAGQDPSPGLFFGAGSLLLGGGLALAAGALDRWRTHTARTPETFTLPGLGARHAARQPARSLATLGLIACGTFLVASIGVFRLDSSAGSNLRSSGTGGFALIGESVLPVVQDLNSAKGRDTYALDADALAGVSVVPLRVNNGEDASCLNLNRAQKPRLLGIRPEALAERGAFRWGRTIAGPPPDLGWLLLKPHPANPAAGAAAPGEPELVPAIGDAASIQWALGKRVGETIDAIDERGQPFKIWIVGAVENSILQGNLLIDEAAFVRLFPSASGYRMFLIDAPSNRVDTVAATLSSALRGVGMELTPAPARLAEFQAVQNTYLGTFQALGGLGLLLGSLGLGLVVLRNVLERRSELALLRAVGFAPRAIHRLVFSEHVALLSAGLGLGLASAALAVLPALAAPGAQPPGASLPMTLAAVLLNGLIWTWLAATLGLRGPLLDSLRRE